MARRLIWSIEARTSLKNLFDYWNTRNTSKLYSNKLIKLFNENLKIAINLPEFGHPTTFENTKYIIISHFEIIYKRLILQLYTIERRNKKRVPSH